MKLLQLNLNHCEVAQDLLRQTVAEKQIDVAIISEQYRRGEVCTWVADTTDKAAIWACGKLPIQEVAVQGEAGWAECMSSAATHHQAWTSMSSIDSWQ